MSAIQVPAYTSQYFGYDGPWQAVTVGVGGFFNGSTADSQWTTVQLLPGSNYSSWFVSRAYCQNSDLGGNCGAGGMWNPGINQTQSGEPVDFMPTLNAPGISASGLVYIENLSIVDSNGVTQTAPNVTLAEISTGNMTYANGAVTNINLGILSLGAPGPMQFFTRSATNASIQPIIAWLLPAWLYNTSIIPSYSFAIQVGSAALDHPISLWFGGYDKSRAIGPYTTWGINSLPLLLDITIGIEIGGSPFNFISASGLLLDNTSTPAPIPIAPDALAPGLHLPKQTCDNLAKHLPIRFDTSTSYYMWDTSSPSYTKIVKSPAYLGMIFSPAATDTSNVTIKVPFSLLNLTLEPIISGLDAAAPYFPCIPTSTDYTLGRAFLQAGFWACNWNRAISWLAQAPGPGPSKEGLGTLLPVNIQNDDTSIDLFEGSSLFSDSWSNYWIPLPDDGDTTATSSHGRSGLSTGAAAGIGVGVGVGVLLLLVAAAIFFWCRRRRRNDQPVPQSDMNRFNDRDEPDSSADYYGDINATEGSMGYSHHVPISELAALRYAFFPAPQELSGSRDPVELDTRNKRVSEMPT